MAWELIDDVGINRASASTVATATFVGPQEGSLLIACLALSATSTVTAPSGWELIDSHTSGMAKGLVYAKIAASGEETTPEWTINPNCNWILKLSEWAGHDSGGAGNTVPFYEALGHSDGSDDSLETGNLPLRIAGSLLVCLMVAAVSDEDIALDSGDWSVLEGNAYTDVCMLTSYKVSTGDVGANEACNALMGQSASWLSVTAEFKAQNVCCSA